MHICSLKILYINYERTLINQKQDIEHAIKDQPTNKLFLCIIRNVQSVILFVGYDNIFVRLKSD